METIKNRIEASGEHGSIQRLMFISRLNYEEYPQECIEAARRVIEKRDRRIELMELGFSKSEIQSIINNEFYKP